MPGLHSQGVSPSGVTTLHCDSPRHGLYTYNSKFLKEWLNHRIPGPQNARVSCNSISICKTAVTNYFVKTEKGLQARLGRKKCRGKGGWRVIGMASWKEKVILELAFFFLAVLHSFWDPSSSTSDQTQATTV